MFNDEFDFSYEVAHILENGKLYNAWVEGDKWSNVYGHQATQLKAGLELTGMLELPYEDRERIGRVAWIHDWRKRLTIKPDDFTKAEKRRAEKEIARINPDKDLMRATGVEFMLDIASGKEPSFMQRLQFYLDEITKGSEIVSLDERIDEVSTSNRGKKYDYDPELTANLGGVKYWDFERKFAHETEEIIVKQLKDKGVQIPEGGIPQLLREKIGVK